jgi:hypothetical protein
MKNLSLILAIFFASSFAIMAQLNNNPNSGNGGLRDNSNTGRGGEHRPGSHDNHGNNNNGNGNWNNNNNNNNNGNWTNHNGHHHDNGNGSWNGNNNNGHHHGNGHNHGHNHGNGNWNNNNGHNHNGHHHYNSYCSYGSHGFNWVAVHIDIFNSNCHNIRNYGFDSDRLQAAKYFANNNHLSVAQVCDLMNMLSFESSRLEFAKFAFARTCDIQNYHLVFNYLSFNSSRRDLDFYISTFRF